MMVTAEFKGKHAFVIFLMAFALIIAANITLVFFALNSFPGLEVKNSYVASQTFDRRRHAQQGLNWNVMAKYKEGKVFVILTDKSRAPIENVEMEVVIGRTSHKKQDIKPNLIFDGNSYIAHAQLSSGLWVLRLKAISPSDVLFEQRIRLWVD